MKESWSGPGDGGSARWTKGWVILVHGGAGRSDHDAARIEGCRKAAQAAGFVLAGSGSALDAVQAAVHVLEDDPLFNAGTGACLTQEGLIELDASIMEGSSMRVGAVCALPPFRNPVDIARAVLNEGRHVLYAGEGAASFARGVGFEPSTVEAMTTERARRKWEEFKRGALAASAAPTGTVGAVARDRYGLVAAATSTGGTLGKKSGRVGDSPIVGAGTFADDEAGGASATGHGEGIMRLCLSKSAVDDMRGGLAPESAARRAIERLSARVGATGGIILIDPSGRIGLARSTPSMAWGASWQGAADPVGGT
ncbi:MAG TPA: isoaspartyl peptidase/L-asparaginase [Polyangiaceae bacterium]